MGNSRKLIHLIFAVIHCPDSLPSLIFKTTHPFSQVTGTYIHTNKCTDKPVEVKIKYFLILPETQEKEGENEP